MRVKRIGWAGTRTSEYPAMVAFLQAVLGLTTSQEGADFAAFQLPEGGIFEVFGPRDQDHAHFSTGPVVGFVVDDLDSWTKHLEAHGAPNITTLAEMPPTAHTEIKLRGPDNVVIDISPSPWPGSAPVDPATMKQPEPEPVA